MSNSSNYIYASRLFICLEQQLHTLPQEQHTLSPQGLSGSYTTTSIALIRLDDATRVIQELVDDPSISSLTTLPRHLSHQITTEIQRLPSHKLRRDPLRQFHKTATLVLEEKYVELNYVLEVCHEFAAALEHVEAIVLELLATVIQLKAARLQQPGIEVGDAHQGAQSTVSPEFLQSPMIQALPELALNLLPTIAPTQNGHGWERSLLLQMSQRLDQLLLKNFEDT